VIFGRKDWTIEKLIQKVPENEPVLLIRGQDQLAPTIATHYISLLRNLKTHNYRANPELINQLIMQRENIERWAVKKFADLGE
jgi:hypothetical protein